MPPVVNRANSPASRSSRHSEGERHRYIQAQHSVVKTVSHKDINELWGPGGGNNDCRDGRAYSREDEEETLGMFGTKGRV